MTRLAAPPYNPNSHWTNPTYPTYCGYNLLPHWGESPPHLQPCLNHQGHGPRSVESLDSLKRHGWNLWVAKTCLRMPKFGSQTSKRKIISDRWQHCGTETWSNYSNTSNTQSSQPPQKKAEVILNSLNEVIKYHGFCIAFGVTTTAKSPCFAGEIPPSEPR